MCLSVSRKKILVIKKWSELLRKQQLRVPLLRWLVLRCSLSNFLPHSNFLKLPNFLIQKKSWKSWAPPTPRAVQALPCFFIFWNWILWDGLKVGPLPRPALFFFFF